MKKHYSLILLFSVLFFSGARTYAQMVGDCEFLQAAHLEIGISPNGSFGAAAIPPAGYHSGALTSGSFSLYDPGSATTVSGALIGFIADPDMDGWAVGTPPLFGDYFIPGFPQEGWSIQVNGVQSDAWLSLMGSGGYSGTLSGTTLSYSTSGLNSYGVWQGNTTDPLQITQTTTLNSTKMYFTVHVKIKNTGSTVAPNVYYLRTLDPDNTAIQDGGYTTENAIAYQLPNANNDVMVTAHDATYTQAFLGLGTRDCRAKCFICTFGLTPSYTLDALYDESSGYYYAVGDSTYADAGIGLVYNLGNIAAGDSTDLTFAYVLRGADLDSALAITSPAVLANATLLTSGSDTLSACGAASDTLPVMITSGDSYTWTWSPATALTATTGTTSSVILTEVTTPITYTLVGVPISAGLCSNDTFHFTVLPGISLPPSVSPVNYCLGDPATALTAGGTNILWYTSETGGTGSSVAPTPSTMVAGTFVYWATQQNGACGESARAPLIVTVTALPHVDASNNGPLCQGATLILTASDTATGVTPIFTWTGPGYTGSGQIQTITNVPLSATGTYTVIMNVNGCKDTTTTSVIINPNPALSTISMTSPSACNLSDGTITIGLLAPGATFTVFHSYNGGALVSATYTADASGYLVIPGLYAGIYTNIYVMNNNGCVSNALAITVPDGVAPTPPTLSSNGPVCRDSLLLLYAADTTGGITYQWVGPNGFSSTQQNPFITDATPATLGTYYCTITITATGCTSSASSILISYKPTPIVNIATTHSVCLHDTLSFTSSGPAYPGAIYLWTVPNSATIVTGSDSIAGPIGVQFDSSYNHQVVLEVNLNGCTVKDTTAVYVVPTPAASLYVSPDVCIGDTVVAALTSTTYSPVISSYIWDFDSATVVTSSSTGGGPYSIYWTTPGIKILHVTAYTLQSACPSFTKYDTVNVYAAPDATFTGSGAVCTGDSVLLTANTINTTYSYAWAPTAFFSGAVNTPSIYATILIPSYISLTVSNAFGCTATDSLFYNPSSCCGVVFPEAFSPNADGHNDYFRAITPGHHQLNIFRVVNRWGTTVYETVNTDTQGWDGTYGGVPQDMDTYYWYIKYTCDGRTYENSGDVILVR